MDVFLIGLGFGALIAVITVSSLVSKNKTSKISHSAQNYEKDGSFGLSDRADRFTGSRTTRVCIKSK